MATLLQNQHLLTNSADRVEETWDSDERRRLAYEAVKDGLVEDEVVEKLFAVVHVGGKQWKVTCHDIVMINNRMRADVGELVRLEKVLSVGGRSGTLIGQPLLKRALVTVHAKVMEKAQGEQKISFKFKKRKGYRRWKTSRDEISVLKIKNIQLNLDAL